MSIRFLQVSRETELKQLFSTLKVDPYGIKIMAPKASNFLIRLEDISCIAANILKQEALSCGADLALPREVLTGKAQKTSCILIASLSQLNRLKEKLLLQPFGLSRLARDIDFGLKNYLKSAKPARVMGIINLTPDSFSGDGLCGRGIDSISDYRRLAGGRRRGYYRSGR